MDKKNCPKLNTLKPQTFIISKFPWFKNLGAASLRGSGQGLKRLQSKLHLGCSLWRLEICLQDGVCTRPLVGGLSSLLHWPLHLAGRVPSQHDSCSPKASDPEGEIKENQNALSDTSVRSIYHHISLTLLVKEVTKSSPYSSNGGIHSTS